MKRFVLVRDEDSTGISGTGVVAEGVELQDGRCVLNWLTNVRSVGYYRKLEYIEEVHGHGGLTRVVFVDEEHNDVGGDTNGQGKVEEEERKVQEGRACCKESGSERRTQEQVDEVEALAAYAHDAWSGWMIYLFGKCRHGADYIGMTGYIDNGTRIIPQDYVERWMRQLETKYEDLPEQEKESDRKEARKILKVLGGVRSG